MTLSGEWLRGWRRSPSIKVMTVLVSALFIIDAISVWGIFSSKRDAERFALEELQLQTKANALSIEAVLSSRRGDFIYLSQSPPLADAPELLLNRNPMAKRWGRLDLEGSLLLFLAAHPEVERLAIRDARSRPLVVAGRRDGAPVLLPVDDYAERTPAHEGFVVGFWPLHASQEQPGTLETVLDVSALVRVAVPGMSSQFALLQRDVAGDAHADGKDSFLAAVPVRDDGWPVPVRWSLVCRSVPSGVLGSVTTLAERYGLSAILNLVIMSLALVIGLVSLQHVRRAMALEEQNRQQIKVRELERQVMHNERLASIGRLAAGMAHEINNPLEGMSNYLALLEDDLRFERADGSLELAGRVREGLERVAGVIRQVLNLADPGSAPHSPLDLNEVLADTAAFVRANPSFKEIEVVLRPCYGELRVLGNRVILGQLFLNLFINACQAQPDGGQIQIASHREKDRAVVLVADCGPGIAPEALPRIFDPFYSTRGSTGLGLFVCHGIVEEHRGKISAQNRMGGGALFKVEFPREEAAEVQDGDAAGTVTNP